VLQVGLRSPVAPRHDVDRGGLEVLPLGRVEVTHANQERRAVRDRLGVSDLGPGGAIAVPSYHGERHAREVARDRRFRRVEVAVCIEPDDASRGMVKTRQNAFARIAPARQDERELPSTDSLPDEPRQIPADGERRACSITECPGALDPNRAREVALRGDDPFSSRRHVAIGSTAGAGTFVAGHVGNLDQADLHGASLATLPCRSELQT
jgi:hypothetical protein